MKPGDIIQGKLNTASENKVRIIKAKHRVEGAFHVERFWRDRAGRIKKSTDAVYGREFDVIEEA